MEGLASFGVDFCTCSALAFVLLLVVAVFLEQGTSTVEDDDDGSQGHVHDHS